MRTSITFFGTQLGMARRTNRRILVVVFYAVFFLGLALSWLSSRGSHGGFFWATLFTVLLGPILGGYFVQSTSLIGGASLVEPFNGRKPLYYPKKSGMSYFRSLFYSEVDPDPGLRIDERSVRNRNRAAYRAFNILGALVIIAMLVGWIGGDPESFYGLGMTVEQSHRVVRLLLQIGYLFALTLPQAIMLWNEPDIEVDSESATR